MSYGEVVQCLSIVFGTCSYWQVRMGVTGFGIDMDDRYVWDCV